MRKTGGPLKKVQKKKITIEWKKTSLFCFILSFFVPFHVIFFSSFSRKRHKYKLKHNLKPTTDSISITLHLTTLNLLLTLTLRQKTQAKDKLPLFPLQSPWHRVEQHVLIYSKVVIRQDKRQNDRPKTRQRQGENEDQKRTETRQEAREEMTSEDFWDKPCHGQDKTAQDC